MVPRLASAALFLLFAFTLLLASDEPLAAAPAGALPIVWLFSSLLSDWGDGAACPVVSGADFRAGATFSAGAVCCAAGAFAGISSVVFKFCAHTAPAPSSNTAAVVDISRRFLMGVSVGQSERASAILYASLHIQLLAEFITNAPNAKKFQKLIDLADI